jgi:two-component system cell cycle sensor histidine kinase/response regulator CckA
MDTQKRVAQAEKPDRPLSVLLVEDDPGVVVVAEAWLRKLKCDVLVARDGRQAEKIAAARGDPIDLLIADVMLPGMRGPTLAGAIRRTHPETAVLFTSGYSPELVSELFASQLDTALLIKKPYNASQLQAGMNVALARKGGTGPS